MKKDSKFEIQEKINASICPKDNKCSKSKFYDICKAEDIGLESFIICLMKKEHVPQIVEVSKRLD
jgi:hypothetical protein